MATVIQAVNAAMQGSRIYRDAGNMPMSDWCLDLMRQLSNECLPFNSAVRGHNGRGRIVIDTVVPRLDSYGDTVGVSVHQLCAWFTSVEGDFSFEVSAEKGTSEEFMSRVNNAFFLALGAHAPEWYDFKMPAAM